MKKMIRGLAFFAVTAAALYFLSVFLNPAGWDQPDTLRYRNKNLNGLVQEEKNSIDILFMGDSEAAASFDPMSLWADTGYTSYNLGNAAERLQDTCYKLTEALKTQDPQAVVLDTNEFFSYKSVIGRTDAAIQEKAGQVFPLFRYHNFWKNFLLMGSAEREWKGYEIRGEVSACDTGNYVTSGTETEPVPAGNLTYLDRIISICREEKIALVFVSSASPVNYSAARHNSIRKVADENQIPFIDLNEQVSEIGIDWDTDSLDDGDHLNLSGAVKTTEYMGEILSKYCTDEKRKNKNVVKEWNHTYHTYQQTADPVLKKIRRQ